MREIATRICDGEHREADLQTAFIACIARAFDKRLAGGARRAYLDLLLLQAWVKQEGLSGKRQDLNAWLRY